MLYQYKKKSFAILCDIRIDDWRVCNLNDARMYSSHRLYYNLQISYGCYRKFCVTMDNKVFI